MSSKNYPLATKYYEETAGFIFTTAEGQRLLKSRSTGFIEPDIAKATAHVGLVDWTDGKNTVTWNSRHRYATPDGNNAKVYRNNTEFNFSEFLYGGMIAGAAFKSGVFIVFSTNYIGALRYHFIQNNTVLNSAVIGTYSRLTQCVTVSADCIKAAFIAIKTGQDGLSTTAFELTLDLVNHTVSIATETNQSFAENVTESSSSNSYSYTNTGFTYWYFNSGHQSVVTYSSGTATNNSYSKTKTSVSITAAIDYDKNNVLKKFIVTQSYSATSSFSTGERFPIWKVGGVESTNIPGESDLDNNDPENGWYFDRPLNTWFLNGEIGTVEEKSVGVGESTFTHTINYNGLSCVSNQDKSYTGDTSVNTADFNYLLINELDLRYDVFGYTKKQEIISLEDDIYTINNQFKMKVGSDLFDIAANTTQTNAESSMRHRYIIGLPEDVHLATYSELFEIILNYTSSLQRRNSIAQSNSIIDAYANKMIKAKAITGFDVDVSGYMQSVSYANKIFKIDNTNSMKNSSTILELIGVK